MTDERIMMRNPNTGRDDCRIKVSIYEPTRDAILEAVGEAGELRYSELASEVERRTPADLWEDNSVGWFTATVKLHLEAEGQIVKSGSPQVLSLA